MVQQEVQPCIRMVDIRVLLAIRRHVLVAVVSVVREVLPRIRMGASITVRVVADVVQDIRVMLI